MKVSGGTRRNERRKRRATGCRVTSREPPVLLCVDGMISSPFSRRRCRNLNLLTSCGRTPAYSMSTAAGRHAPSYSFCAVLISRPHSSGIRTGIFFSMTAGATVPSTGFPPAQPRRQANAQMPCRITHHARAHGTYFSQGARSPVRSGLQRFLHACLERNRSFHLPPGLNSQFHALLPSPGSSCRSAEHLGCQHQLRGGKARFSYPLYQKRFFFRQVHLVHGCSISNGFPIRQSSDFPNNYRCS